MLTLPLRINRVTRLFVRLSSLRQIFAALSASVIPGTAALHMKVFFLRNAIVEIRSYI